MMHFTVGSRGSRLALAQTNWVCEKLKQRHPEATFEVKIIKTKGDQILDKALDKIGDKGLFIKELEQELLDQTIDFAVHSMKDMPSQNTEGLCFAMTPLREDPRDCLILKEGYKTLEDLPQGAVLGTGSKRRIAQLKAIRPDLKFKAIRGNIETRISKIETEGLDGVVLAAAGLHRLDLKHKITAYLEAETLIPAPAQGALAIQYRTADERTKAVLEDFGDPLSHVTATAERAFLEAIGGSCHVPVGAISELKSNSLELYALFGSEDGKEVTWEGTCDFEGLNLETHLNEMLALATELGKEAAEEVKKEMDNLNKQGTVYLIGAGPGDPELLTVRGKKLLEKADVLVYDRLVSDGIIALAPASAKKIYVGKAAANHAMKQEDINRLLVELSKDYQTVVRLKGGDPYVFGRGGEEGEELFASGVNFEVVPGITSAIGGLCYGGIPITHRDMTSSFHVFTGHFKDDERDHDWENIAKLKGTKVFLMGVGNLEYIMDKTLSNGMREDMPVAIISNATRPEQKVLVTTAIKAVEDAAKADIKPPSLLVIGEVVHLREQLNWFENRPLFGKKIAVTRASAQMSRLAGMLTELGAEVLEMPAIKIVPRPLETLAPMYNDLAKASWLVFTSENGVSIFMEGLLELGKDARAIGNAKIAVIGSGTARKLAEYGLKPDLMPKRFVAEGLIEAFEEAKLLSKNDFVLLPRASEARSELSDYLAGICQLSEIHLYDTVPELALSETELEKLEAADYITFTSASTVKHFYKQLEKAAIAWPAELEAFSIGPVTTDALKIYNRQPVREAKVHDLKGLVEAIVAEVNSGTF